MDDGSEDSTVESLRSQFGPDIAAHRLRILEGDSTGDPGALRNRGVAASRGAFIAFLNPEDWWKPGRLKTLEPQLHGHDLLLATDSGSYETLSGSSDWLKAFLWGNPAVLSSAVIRRTLFDELGGFPEGYYARGVPGKLPGREDYELWLKALTHLKITGRKDRFLMVRNDHVVTERDTASNPLLPVQVMKKVDLFREVVTLARIAPSLPRMYWGTLARRLAENGMDLISRKR